MNIVEHNEHVTRIVDDLRQEATSRRKRLQALSLESGRVDANDRTSSTNVDFSPLNISSPLPNKSRSRFDVHELLAYEDLDFIHNAYEAILKRPPEPTAVANATDGLRSGRVDKIDLLTWLVSSAEARDKGVEIEGLPFQAFLLRLCRLPFLRYLTKPTYDFLHLRARSQSQRRNIRLLIARQNSIASYINENLVQQFSALMPKMQAAVRLSEEQKQTYDTILERISDLSRYSEERVNEAAMQRQQDVKDRTAEIEQLRKVYNQYRTQLELTEKDLKRQMEHLFRKYQEVTTELVYQNERLRTLNINPAAVSRSASALADNSGSASPSRELDALFASFDEHFRGNREDIKRRLLTYLPRIREYKAGTSDAPILDVACGRGEWLEVLSDAKLLASGVDSNSVLVRQCRKRGLEVTQSDLFEYLSALPDNSLGAVSAFHILEHLAIEQVIAVLDQSLRVLRAGGLLLLETPNPENVLVGSCNFYLDPTHRKPLPSAVLKFLVESRGFLIIETLSLNPSDEQPVRDASEVARRFNQYFYGPMDYGIVARKV